MICINQEKIYFTLYGEVGSSDITTPPPHIFYEAGSPSSTQEEAWPHISLWL